MSGCCNSIIKYFTSTLKVLGLFPGTNNNINSQLVNDFPNLH